ncbi:aldo/keto reductase [Rhizophagus irregularis]|uniref:Aldo/keto reductase n=1 Tax=Rhizophagus irregularis TaxID=588596 RepID=A0A2I1GJQ0_9GLOM|nr:aldo/keto reductase [Rhizophagus irregularis]
MSFLRELGKTGVKISAIGLGCMENIKVLNRAIDIGCTFWDTADFYGSGANEILLSKALEERSEVFLCTKFAFSLGPNGEISILGKPEYVRQACENSLKRLGDYIDLYYQSRVDPNTPIEDTVDVLAELVKEGKIKYIGLSECSAETLRLLEACRELGVTIVAYSPLGHGFLTPNDFRRSIPRFQGENFNKNLEIVHKFNEFASKKGVTAGQLCLAWVLAQGDDFVTIPGTKKLKYLEENFEAGNIHLSPEEISEIRKIIDSIEIFGGRYNEQLSIESKEKL